MHDATVITTRTGYQARCSCGWLGPVAWYKQSARGHRAGHISDVLTKEKTA